MKAYEKVWDLLSKINGQVIDDEMWNKASDYAKKDLKRKANIVIDEVIVIGTEMLIDEDNYVETKSYLAYWQEVRGLLNAL
jgi:hypothetical protein